MLVQEFRPQHRGLALPTRVWVFVDRSALGAVALSQVELYSSESGALELVVCNADAKPTRKSEKLIALSGSLFCSNSESGFAAGSCPSSLIRCFLSCSLSLE